MYVKLLESTIVREAAEGGLVINVESGEDCFVNESGVFFMNALNGCVQDVDTIVHQLEIDFDGVGFKELRQDIYDFLLQMKDKHFVELSEKAENITTNVLKTLHVDITMACNERCIHCYLPNTVKNKAAELPFDLFCRLVEEFVELGGKEITLSGGEPLLHDDIIPMLLYCHEKGLRINLFSNLTLLSDQYIDVLKKINVVLVQVSVYSLKPAIHERITKMRGSLTKTMIAIEHLIREKIPVQIACPVMAQNKDEVPSLMKYTKQHGITLRAGGVILPQIDGNDTFCTSSSLSLEQRRRMICDMMDEDEVYAKELLETRNFSKSLYENPKAFLKSHICDAGFSQCAVSPTGDVFPCPEWQTYCLGNISEHTLTEIWNNSPRVLFLRQMNRQSNLRKCLGCKALDFCKRCLMANSLDGQGELLNINPQNCEMAFMLKSAMEVHETKKE